MSQQSQEQYQFIEQILRRHIGAFTQIDAFQFFYGGNFNLAVRVEVNKNEYFIKWTPAEHKGLFATEAENLALIARTRSIDVPQVIGVGQLEEKEYLVLSCVQSTEKKSDYWIDFGTKLAHLHQNTATEGHGLAYDNYIGAAKQINTWTQNGVDFFVTHRLKAQVDHAVYARKIDAKLEEKFQTLFARIHNILPDEKPALLHGDLWSGNAMVNELGEVTLVDPSCYYGLREAELAFTTMFGGFDQTFYEAYHRTYPIEKDFHQRIPIYNLYPLLVHVNLFGEGYLPAVEKILDTY